ncbi:urease accessory protein UreE [Leptolyngbya sp. 'hensonii']|uniref:urease accessory protein UreE n=1 Tax=Leptolyngbya sp. 'hensonii' TaxID=1922337 RepID=UPI0009500D2F|nr:urease accessory protein UreE [Leptolyngbya sp. 'hensonii']OLP15717.1 urease accessory protein UreE [Leptolyngbya sp. 'hensonii']
MLTLTRRVPPNPSLEVDFLLALSAEERTHSRLRIEAPEGQVVLLALPRGTVLQDGDLLESEAEGETRGSYRVRVAAKPEPVMTVHAATPLDLLRAAYHLGNRHVPLEITPTYLRFSADAVLKALVEQLGLQVQEASLPFYPEMGAYGHGH